MHARCVRSQGRIKNARETRALPGRFLIAVLCFAAQLAAGFSQSCYQEGLDALRAGSFDKALRSAQRCVELDPARADHHHLLGLALGGHRRFDEGISAIQKAIELKPSQPGFHYDLGILYTSAGRPALALEAFKRAVALDPENLQALLFLGRTYHNLNYSGLARRQFETILRRDLRYPGAHYHLAKIHQNAGNQAAARRELELEIRLQPKDSLARLELAEILLRQGEPAVALRHLDTLATPRALYLRGKAEWMNHRPSQAIEALRESVRLDPQFAEPHYLLSQIYQQTGRADLARAELALFEKLRKP